MNSDANIYIAGHRGLVGSAIQQRLVQRGFTNITGRTRHEVDLLDSTAVDALYAEQNPEFVFLAAAHVGGIMANSLRPAEFIRNNLVIQNNVIEASYRSGVKRLLFLGSSCIYPRQAAQPLSESALLTGPLEPSNRPYAVAKIAGIELCWSYNRQYGTAYLTVMPTNLYGPNDNFDLNDSHVLPALLRKAAEAKRSGARRMVVWGTGTPRREFLHSEDLADACVFLMSLPDEMYQTLLTEEEPPLINIGTGEDLTIRELAELVKAVTGFRGSLFFDTTKPDGTPQKLLDVARLHRLGWHHTISLREGVERTWAALQQQSGW